MASHDDARRRARDFAEKRQLVLGEELGHGTNGVVFLVQHQNPSSQKPRASAVKACQRQIEYVRERDIYFRLQERCVTKIRSCAVPQLLDFDDDLWILEMTVVSRPFCLDFGGAYLEKPPDFSDEVMADWRAEKIEQFGAHWPEVQLIIAVLEVHGIFLMDVHPRNIAFAD